MSHWAELDSNNIVVRVVVGNNDDPNNDEGYQWLVDNLGGRWVQTSYNNNFRKQYAGIGYYYNEVADVFIAPQPYSSWLLDENYDWVPPIPQPDPILSPDGYIDYFFEWDDSAVEWKQVSTSPFPSWTRNENGFWVAPVPYPDVTISDEGVPSAVYNWDEETLSWKLSR